MKNYSQIYVSSCCKAPMIKKPRNLILCQKCGLKTTVEVRREPIEPKTNDKTALEFYQTLSYKGD